jgi:GAF domain-containing protein
VLEALTKWGSLTEKQQSAVDKCVERAKSRRRKTITQKGRGPRNPSSADHKTQSDFAQLIRERDEALEREKATAEVLRVISSSPGELEPVFEALLENATKLCEAKFGVLFRSEGDALRAVALHGAPPAYAEERHRVPLSRPDPTTMLGRALRTKQPVQIADIRDEPDGSDAGVISTGAKLAKLAGARTTLAVPMVKEQGLVGAILIFRQEVRQLGGSLRDQYDALAAPVPPYLAALIKQLEAQ